MIDMLVKKLVAGKQNALLRGVEDSFVFKNAKRKDALCRNSTKPLLYIQP